MKLYAPADLHTHSKYSDGQGSPEQIVALAAKRGLRTISITDHDCLEAAKWAYAYMRHREETGDDESVAVLPGVEISSRIERDGIIDVVHILGYGFDPFTEPLQRLCAGLQEARIAELRKRIAYVREKGYPLSPDAEARILRDAYWGRGEIARELVLARIYETVDEAYHAIWDEYGNTSGIQDFADAQSAITAIHDACGIAILAHPFRCETDSRKLHRSEVVERLDVLQPMGLDGLEAYYRTHSEFDCEFLGILAQDRRLMTSCGSDHHDFRKRDRLGRTTSNGENMGHLATILNMLGR